MRALEAIAAKAGHKLRLLSLDITAEAIDRRNPGSGRSRPRRALAGVAARRVDVGARRHGGQRAFDRADPGAGSLDENLFELRAGGPRAICRELADAALARARLQEPGAVIQMELRRPLQDRGQNRPSSRRCGRSGSKAGGNRRKSMPILSGKITLTNLRGTLRYQRLDLRAGGPDLDELVQQIRDEIKDRWAVRYVEVETKSIAFEASLAVHAGRAAGHALHRRVSTVSTPPRSTFPGSAFPAASRPTFSVISDVDWQRLPELQKRARDSVGIADAKIVSVVVLKPKREFGDNEIEWRIGVRGQERADFLDPNSPPVRRAHRRFRCQGRVVENEISAGRRPQGRSARSACAQQGARRHYRPARAESQSHRADGHRRRDRDHRHGSEETRIRSRHSRTAIRRSSGIPAPGR